MNWGKIFAVLCLASATSIASFQILMIFRGNFSFSQVIPYVLINGAVIGGLFYLGVDAISIKDGAAPIARKIMLVRDRAGRILSIQKSGGETLESGTKITTKAAELKLRQLDVTGRYKEFFKTVIVLGLLFEAYAGFCFYSGTFTPLLVVQTESMTPTLSVNDMIWIQAVNPGTIRVGDIITFTAPESIEKLGATTITHRVVDVQETEDNWYYKTKGDNNPSEDPWTVRGDMLVGRYAGSVPVVGSVFSIVRTPIGLFASIIVIIVLINGQELLSERGKAK